MNSNNFLCLIPEMLLVISALILLLLGMVLNRKIINILSFTTVCVAIFFLLKGVVFEPILLFGSLLRSDIYTTIAKFVILGSCAMVLLMFLVSKYEYCYEFSIVILLAVFGMMNLISANDLLSFYLSFEIQSISLYVLACFDRKSFYSSEAGIKYFILGAVSSCILLYGISMLYGYTGNTNFIELANIFSNRENVPLGAILGMVLVFISIFFKLSAVPFHMWSPDVYQGAPTIVTGFFAIVPKATFIMLTIRLLKEIFTFNQFHDLQIIFIFVGLVSVFFSALAAIPQNNLKRIFAYGSIGHVGYMLMSIALGYDKNSIAAFIYLIVYISMNIGLFAYLIQLKDDRCDLSELSNLYYRSPLTAFCLSIIMLSMAGIPPTAGFFTKFYILVELVKSNYIVLAILLILASSVSCYYYLRIIKVMYFSSDNANSKVAIKRNNCLSLILAITTFINMSFFLYCDKLFKYFNYALHFIT